MVPMTPSQEMEADSVHEEGRKKEQAQKNCNRFNLIWVSFSNLRTLFFNLMGKTGWGGGGVYEYHLPHFLIRSLFVLVEIHTGRCSDNLFLLEMDCFLHASSRPPSALQSLISSGCKCVSVPTL